MKSFAAVTKLGFALAQSVGREILVGLGHGVGHLRPPVITIQPQIGGRAIAVRAVIHYAHHPHYTPQPFDSFFLGGSKNHLSAHGTLCLRAALRMASCHQSGKESRFSAAETACCDAPISAPNSACVSWKTLVLILRIRAMPKWLSLRFGNGQVVND